MLAAASQPPLPAPGSPGELSPESRTPQLPQLPCGLEVRAGTLLPTARLRPPGPQPAPTWQPLQQSEPLQGSSRIQRGGSFGYSSSRRRLVQLRQASWGPGCCRRRPPITPLSQALTCYRSPSRWEIQISLSPPFSSLPLFLSPSLALSLSPSPPHLPLPFPFSLLSSSLFSLHSPSSFTFPCHPVPRRHPCPSPSLPPVLATALWTTSLLLPGTEGQWGCGDGGRVL